LPPPIRFAGDPIADWVILIVGAVVCLYWLRALRLARDGARRFLRKIAFSILVFVAIMVGFAAVRLQSNLQPKQEQLVAGIIAFLFLCKAEKRKRSRHISKAVRRAVIKRDLKGEKFDPQKHHIDHVWPFSKGGSHTEDNLRVLDKKKNLQKGARKPRLREMW